MSKAGHIIVIILSVLIIAILWGKTKPSITSLQDELVSAQEARTQAEAAQRTAQAAQRDAEDLAETRLAELTNAKDSLKNAMTALGQQRARGDELDTQLSEVTDQLLDARRELQSWIALGVDQQYVYTMKQRIADAHDEIAAITEEKTVLLRQMDQMRYELGRFVGPTQKVVMRDGLEGNVQAIDSDWGFVIVNVGEKDGARENGELLVSREGKLIGKLLISSVEDNRSIANVIPGWVQSDIQVGDVVAY
jgi:hypothetical protein